MTFGGLIDSHLKAYPKCRTAYEAAEKEKKKSNAARLFGGALTTEPQSKPDGGSSASMTKASTKVNLGAPDSMASSILGGFELLAHKMDSLHKEAMSRIDFLDSKLSKGMEGMQQQLTRMQQQQPPPQKECGPKDPAALTAIKSVDDLLRYYPILRCAGPTLWCSICCTAQPAARLLDDDLLPREGVFNDIYTRKFSEVKKDVTRHIEGGAKHKQKADLKEAREKAAKSQMGTACCRGKRYKRVMIIMVAVPQCLMG